MDGEAVDRGDCDVLRSGHVWGAGSSAGSSLREGGLELGRHPDHMRAWHQPSTSILVAMLTLPSRCRPQVMIKKHPLEDGLTAWNLLSLLYLVICSVYCVLALVGCGHEGGGIVAAECLLDTVMK